MRSKFFLVLFFCTVFFCPLTFVYGQTDLSGRPVNTFSRSYGRTGVFLDAGIYRLDTEATANPAPLNQWKTTILVYEFNAGYINDNHFYYGAQFSSRADNQISINSTTGTSSGLGAGFFSDNGFHVRAYYLFNSTFGNYGNGDGFKVDLGYMKNMAANFFIGVAMTHSQTIFRSNPTIVAFDTWTRRETYPSLNLGVIFN